MRGGHNYGNDCTFVAALIAVEGLLPTVGENVSPQVTGLCTFVVALFADKRFLTSVGKPVRL